MIAKTLRSVEHLPCFAGVFISRNISENAAQLRLATSWWRLVKGLKGTARHDEKTYYRGLNG